MRNRWLRPESNCFKRSRAGTSIVSNPKEYAQHLADADALIVRSAVQVTTDVLAKAPKLRVIGRAGVGVDNVDLDAATAAGVLVMNTPGGNAVSVAEHTLALMLSMARSIPQASASTKSGKWEKKKFLGTELRGKTLGIVGLGSIGREVVKRARAFEMRIMAHDPYVTSQIATDLGVELVALPELYAAERLHHAARRADAGNRQDCSRATPSPKMKTGVRIVNCARGELIDDDALREAIESGKVAGAALDVFQTEPPPAGYPLFALDPVLATPHIGGSTEEAQEIVGVRIAEQMVEYLQNGVAINAVNMPALTPEQYRTLGPVHLAGRAAGQLRGAHRHRQSEDRAPDLLGKIADSNTNLLRNAGLAGVLNRSLAAQGEPGECHADRGAARLERRRAARDALRPQRFGSAGTGNRYRRHHGGRRGAAGQAAADAGGRHLLRSAAGRPSDFHEEPGRARRDRLRGRRARPQQDQHRELLAGPPRRAAQARRAARSGGGGLDRRRGAGRACWRSCGRIRR